MILNSCSRQIGTSWTRHAHFWRLFFVLFLELQQQPFNGPLSRTAWESRYQEVDGWRSRHPDTTLSMIPRQEPVVWSPQDSRVPQSAADCTMAWCWALLASARILPYFWFCLGASTRTFRLVRLNSNLSGSPMHSPPLSLPFLHWMPFLPFVLVWFLCYS